MGHSTACEQHQAASGEVIEQRLADGRWLLIVESRTPSGFTVGNRIDITARKAAQALVNEHSAQLDAIFALSPDGFVSFDASHLVKYISPAFTMYDRAERANRFLGSMKLRFP
jgi:PAS domain-containing protein